MAVKDFLDVVAPNYSKAVCRGYVEICEQNINDGQLQVEKVTWTGADFQHMDHQLSKDMKSFFDLAGSPDVFRKDCDGVVLFEDDGKKYMFLTELKSNFATEVLLKAKTQIVSSFLKTNMLLHLSACYRLEDFIIKGFIVGYPPRRDFLMDLHRQSMVSKNKKEHEYSLARKLWFNNPAHSITLKPTDFLCLKHLPLGDRGIFPKIDLHYIPVNPPDREISLSVRNFI